MSRCKVVFVLQCTPQSLPSAYRCKCASPSSSCMYTFIYSVTYKIRLTTQNTLHAGFKMLWTVQQWESFLILEHMRRDDLVRAVVWSATGDRAFSSGASLKGSQDPAIPMEVQKAYRMQGLAPGQSDTMCRLYIFSIFTRTETQRHKDTKTLTQTQTQTDRQTDRRTDRQTHRQTHRCARARALSLPPPPNLFYAINLF